MAIQEIPEEEREDDDPLLWMIKQLSEDKLKFVWPCIINIFIQAGLFENVASEEIKVIADSLQSATPKTFNNVLAYEEKVKILIFLCNSCHDLHAFREYISARLKEKSNYSKEKQETYTEIRKVEQEKRKLMHEHADSDFVKNDGVNNQIVVLEEELKNASRTQGKLIRDKLNNLNREKDDFRKTIQEFEEKIEGMNAKIARLNDQIWKVSLKVSIIGRDLENEYWFYKDDPTKLYVKDLSNSEWGYYNDEDTILELENSLITKGSKERKLYEGLRKLKGKMKIKKSKELPLSEDGSKPDNIGETNQDTTDVPNEEQTREEVKDQSKGEVKKVQPTQPDMEVDEDSKYESYKEEVDWEKNLEKAIQFSMKRSEITTRKCHRLNSKKLDSLTIESIKEKILELEEDYTNTARDLSKAWAPYSVIEQIRNIILQSEDEEKICQVLLKLEEGFSNPMNFKSSEGAPESSNMEVDGESQSNMSNRDNVANRKIFEDGIMFYRNNRKIKKFWSSDTLKDCWKDYIANIQNGSISALFLSVCIFIDQTEIYIEKLNTKLEKKKQVEERSNKCSKRSSKDSERNDRKRKAGFYKEDSSVEASEDQSK